MIWPCRWDENKTFNLKDITSLKTFARHSYMYYWYSYQVLNRKQLERNYMTWNRKQYSKITHFQQKSTEICVFIQAIFLGATLEPEWKYGYARYTMYRFHSGSRVAPRKIICHTASGFKSYRYTGCFLHKSVYGY
jgi:hypothetical protein